MANLLSIQNESDAVSKILSELNAGKPVAIPTETVYGLAADATNGEAVARVFEMKGRPSFNPLICHVDGLVMAEQHCLINDIAATLATAFWPGPLTIVVPQRKNSTLHDLVSADLDTIGLRCPQGISRQIISAFGKPLAAPSANLSGKISPTRAEHVMDDFYDHDLIVADGGPSTIGLESTIIKIDVNSITLLRSGAITKEEIEVVTGQEIKVVEAGANIQAPGMMESHYAPEATMHLDCETNEEGAAWLGFGNREIPKNANISLNLSEESNLVEAAANLYAFLKQLDASGANKICVSPIPHEDLGIAINDRLKRSAAPRPGDISSLVKQHD